MCRRLSGCGCLILILILVAACGLFYFGGNAVKGLVQTPTNFLTALQNGDYSTAYTYLSSDFQNQLGGPGGLSEKLPGGGISSWNLTGFSQQNSQAQVTIDATFANSSQDSVTINLTYVNNEWKIAGLDVKPLAQ